MDCLFKMEEVWKDVPNYEGLYQVSSLGRIKTCRGKITYGWDKGGGYKKIKLYKNKKHKSVYVHRIVAAVFIKNLKGYPYVNHIDSVPFNNKSSNLEWCTHAQNMNHAAKNGRMNGNPKTIINTQSGIFYNSIKEAAESINMKPNSLVVRLIGRVKNDTNFIYA